ncbi:hypothetical protein B9Q02_06360, partial [Candidatus Marsarchaeota G1 archaeon BE_D]
MAFATLKRFKHTNMALFQTGFGFMMTVIPSLSCHRVSKPLFRKRLAFKVPLSENHLELQIKHFEFIRV